MANPRPPVQSQTGRAERTRKERRMQGAVAAPATWRSSRMTMGCRASPLQSLRCVLGCQAPDERRAWQQKEREEREGEKETARSSAMPVHWSRVVSGAAQRETRMARITSVPRCSLTKRIPSRASRRRRFCFSFRWPTACSPPSQHRCGPLGPICAFVLVAESVTEVCTDRACLTGGGRGHRINGA